MFSYNLQNIYKRKVFFISGIPDNFMNGFNKELVKSKLIEMGMENIATRLDKLSEQEIEKLIRSNPEILRKASQIMKGEAPFK